MFYRSLCLSTDEAFEQGKTLPFINPSSLETLRALVQEIQSSGETDPEIWKDCEVGKYPLRLEDNRFCRKADDEVFAAVAVCSCALYLAAGSLSSDLSHVFFDQITPDSKIDAHIHIYRPQHPHS